MQCPAHIPPPGSVKNLTRLSKGKPFLPQGQDWSVPISAAYISALRVSAKVFCWSKSQKFWSISFMRNDKWKEINCTMSDKLQGLLLGLGKDLTMCSQFQYSDNSRKQKISTQRYLTSRKGMEILEASFLK